MTNREIALSAYEQMTNGKKTYMQYSLEEDDDAEP